MKLRVWSKSLFEILSREILSGKYAPGQKFPSEAGLVLQFHTSRITTGRAIRELTQRGMVERIAGSGTHVRQVRSGEDGLLFGLPIPDLGQTEIFEPSVRESPARRSPAGMRFCGYTADAGQTPPAARARALCDQVLERRASGVLFLEGLPYLK